VNAPCRTPCKDRRREFKARRQVGNPKRLAFSGLAWLLISASLWLLRSDARPSFGFFNGKPLDMRLAYVLFVGLVGPVVPYIVVIDPGSFDGWEVGRSTLQEFFFKGVTHDR
jgi:hypothetical protein